MGIDAGSVVVAATGSVSVAPAGTALPTDLAALASPWVDLGYVSEDGVTVNLSRDQEVVNAWQSQEPVRVLVTTEPKTITFELIQFDTKTVELALRGGTFDDASGIVTYTPPGAGTTDERAMVIDAVDGAHTYRFAYKRVQLQGDVEWQLVRSDAVRLPLEFGVLAASPTFVIISDSVEWVATATLGGPAGAGVITVSENLTRDELDAIAQSVVPNYDADSYETKRDVVDAIEAARGGKAAA